MTLLTWPNMRCTSNSRIAGWCRLSLCFVVHRLFKLWLGRSTPMANSFARLGCGALIAATAFSSAEAQGLLVDQRNDGTIPNSFYLLAATLRRGFPALCHSVRNSLRHLLGCSGSSFL